MAQEAILRHGDPSFISYTPTTGDVAAGQVVVTAAAGGMTCAVAHLAISNNVQGSVAEQGGVYEVTNLNNAANYAKVWWDDTNNKVTTVSTNNALFGFVVENGGGGANSVCNALHFPYV
jgi:hypothetical protein